MNSVVSRASRFQQLKEKPPNVVLEHFRWLSNFVRIVPRELVWFRNQTTLAPARRRLHRLHHLQEHHRRLQMIHRIPQSLQRLRDRYR